MPPSAKPRRTPSKAATKDQPAPGYGRVLTCLRVRPALSDEEGGVDNVALQCDRSQRLVWALGGHGGEEEAPRQFAFDELLEQHQGQSDLYEAVGSPAVKAATAGGVGCVICYGAQGAGKRYSLNCERVGQEGLLPRINNVLFAERAGGAKLASAMPAPGEHADAPAARLRVEVAYLTLTREQQVRDLLAGPGVALSIDPTSDPLSFATWQPAGSAAEALRLIARGDANKPAEMQGAQAGPRAQHTLVAYRLTHENGTAGTLLLATLADADAVIADGRAEVGTLQPSLEALGCSLEAMAAGAPGDFHLTHSPLTALLAPALGNAAAEEGMARAGNRSERGAAVGIAPPAPGAYDA